MKSREEFYKTERGWIVDYGMDPQLEARFSALCQAGMINLWRRYIQFLRMIKFNGLNRESVSRGDVEKVQRLQIGGNFAVVFYLYSIFILLCKAVLIFENLLERVRKQKIRL